MLTTVTACLRGRADRLRAQWKVVAQYSLCILHGALSKATGASSVDAYWLGICFDAIKTIAEAIDFTSPRLQ
jgi:hypothetical protein